MKVIELTGGFGLENLRTATRPDPRPGPGQVLLRMRAASLNYRDLMLVRGQYDPKQRLPLVPCSDGVGEIVAVGEGVERVAVGDRVATCFVQGWLAGEVAGDAARRTLGGPLDGTLADLMVLDADGVVRVPEHLNDEEAATLPCAALTAWSALVTHGSLEPGTTVLVQGTGGVSVFALQFAQLLGARVILVSGDEAKLERARALGAWHTILRGSDPTWFRTVRERTGGRGVDLVVEVAGGDGLEQSLACVRAGGQISLIGVLAGATSTVSLTRILMRQVRVQGIFTGHRASFEAMIRAIDAHRLRPAVSRIFPREDFRAAFEHMATGRHFGKIALQLA